MRAEVERAVGLLQRQDQDATEEALALLQKTVFSFSMKICGQREDAEDTMQEVLVKSIPYLPRLGNPKALVVWLYKVAKNRCLMSRRKSRFAPRQVLSLEELMPDRQEIERLRGGDIVNPETSAIRNQEVRRLREAVQKLPDPYRTVLVLRDMEGLTGQEVAEITGLLSGTVRVRLHRARLFVRKELSKQASRHAPPRVKAPAKENRGDATPRPGRCRAMFAELSNYLNDDLDDSLCDELERHLDGCEPCKAFLKSLERTIRQCQQMPGEFPSPRRAANIRKQLLLAGERLSASRL